MVVSCILPYERGGLVFGGNESVVVFFSNDQKVSLSRIIQLFYQRVVANALLASKSPHSNATKPTEDEQETFVESILQESLSRLWIIHCKNALQFKISMAALPRRLETIIIKNQPENASSENASSLPTLPRVTLFVDGIDTYALLENKSPYQADPVRALQSPQEGRSLCAFPPVSTLPLTNYFCEPTTFKMEDTIRKWLFATPNSMAFATCSELYPIPPLAPSVRTSTAHNQKQPCANLSFLRSKRQLVSF
jgi:hypothetical protein